MKILTAAEMGAADRRSVEAGVSMAALMEGAGAAVAAFCLRRYPEAARVLVLCGKGNNGGDGFVAARLLAGEGVGVRVLLVGRREDVRGDAAAALGKLLEETEEGVVEELAEDADLQTLSELFGEADLLLDAVLGTGFRPPLRGPASLVRDAVAALRVPVVAVDLPSGWDADSYAETVEGAFRADAVVTFTAPKIAHVFGHLTRAGLGAVVVAAIGSPASAVVSELGLTWTGASKVLAEAARPVQSNKGSYGHVLVVGGSYGTAGAPSMAALACLRAGAGLVTAAVPAAVVNTVARVAPELMVRALWQHDENPRAPEFGTAVLANLEPARLQGLLRGIKVVALGPGLSTQGEASAFARGLFAAAQDREGKFLPVVIDADGLNAFGKDHVADLQGPGRVLVITPHPAEMARLLGCTVAEVERDRIGVARRFATGHGLTLVLKGWRTLVAHPDGRLAINTSGNPALSKGGSGDILTGMVAALLAQFPDDVAAAVEAAVYLHGLAADLAVQRLDEKFILATDVISALSEAFRYRTQDEDGASWLCGVRDAG